MMTEQAWIQLFSTGRGSKKAEGIGETLVGVQREVAGFPRFYRLCQNCIPKFDF
jgi:hypothetical protein